MPAAMIAPFGRAPDETCVFPPAADPQRLAAASAAAPTWVNSVTIRSAENFVDFEAAGWAPYLGNTPLLMVIAQRDVCTFPEVQREVFAAITGPKRLVEHPGGHFDTYREYFEQSGPPARDWFVTHLQGSSPPT